MIKLIIPYAVAVSSLLSGCSPSSDSRSSVSPAPIISDEMRDSQTPITSDERKFRESIIWLDKPYEGPPHRTFDERNPGVSVYITKPHTLKVYAFDLDFVPFK